MKATHLWIENKTPKEIVKIALKAMSDIQDGWYQGTLKRPLELASSINHWNNELIQVIAEDLEVFYNDGFYIVEVNDETIYVDITAQALKDLDYPEYKIIDGINSEDGKPQIRITGGREYNYEIGGL
jgi:hypothetical protein